MELPFILFVYYKRGVWIIKKSVFLIVIFSFAILFASCSQEYSPGSTEKNGDAVTMANLESDKFSEKEINDAVDCVKEKFKDFKGCTLTKLWYDEEKSNDFIRGYLTNGKGSINGVKAENVIVLLSSFDVDSSGGDGSLNPNSSYTNWNWILIRDSETGKWKVDDWGY